MSGPHSKTTAQSVAFLSFHILEAFEKSHVADCQDYDQLKQSVTLSTCMPHHDLQQHSASGNPF